MGLAGGGVAIGSGGMVGQGYGLSTQKLQYLPIQSTDFIYAVFAEEFGFVGSLMLLLFDAGRLGGIAGCPALSQPGPPCSDWMHNSGGPIDSNIAVASGSMPATGYRCH